MAESIRTSRSPERAAERASLAASPAPSSRDGVRCAEHGLALGPDGKCTLCRRPAVTVVTREDDEPSLGARLATLALGVCFVVSALFGVQWARDPASFPLARYARALGGEPVAAAPQPRPALGAAPNAARPPSEGELAAQRLAEQQAEGTEGEADAQQQQPQDATAAARQQRAAVEASQRLASRDGAADLEAARADAAKAEEARRDAERKQMVQAQIDAHATAAAKRAITVVMYGTRWCPYCTKARHYMAREGIGFVERDIDQDPQASARHRELNPRGSVPTFDIDGEALVGFDAKSFEAVMARAVARRTRR